MSKLGRNILRLLLVFLILTVLVLAYIYYLVSRPPAEVFHQRGFKHILSIYGYGTKPEEQLKRPHDVAFGPQGNIYITDTGHRRVLVFNAFGRFLRQIGRPGTGRGEFITPLGIAVGRDGRVYVADETAGKLVVFNAVGKLIRETRVMMPLKPVIQGKRLYLTNYAFLNVYDPSGRYIIDRWGGKGSGRGQFDLPAGMAVNSSGRIFVTDTGNSRVKALDKKGRLLWIAGADKGKKRKFELPAAVAVDEENRLYVVDAFAHELRVLDSTNGKQKAVFSRRGQKEGELYYPAGIAYGGSGLTAIADKFNNRVQLFQVDVK